MKWYIVNTMMTVVRIAVVWKVMSTVSAMVGINAMRVMDWSVD